MGGLLHREGGGRGTRGQPRRVQEEEAPAHQGPKGGGEWALGWLPGEAGRAGGALGGHLSKAWGWEGSWHTPRPGRGWCLPVAGGAGGPAAPGGLATLAEVRTCIGRVGDAEASVRGAWEPPRPALLCLPHPPSVGQGAGLLIVPFPPPTLSPALLQPPHSSARSPAPHHPW